MSYRRLFQSDQKFARPFPSKMYKLKPGPDYYQLLQSAKINVPMTPGLIKVSAQIYLERNYPRTIMLVKTKTCALSQILENS